MLRPLFGDSFGRGLNSASVEAASLAASATFVPARRRRQLCAAASLCRRPPVCAAARQSLRRRQRSAARQCAALRSPRAPSRKCARARAHVDWHPSARQVDLPFPKPPAKFADAQKRHLWSLNPCGGTSWAPSREPAVGGDACGGSRPHGAATRTHAGRSHWQQAAPLTARPGCFWGTDVAYLVFLRSLRPKTVWPSGLRRWLKVPVRKGVGSNATAVSLLPAADQWTVLAARAPATRHARASEIAPIARRTARGPGQAARALLRHRANSAPDCARRASSRPPPPDQPGIGRQLTRADSCKLRRRRSG